MTEDSNSESSKYSISAVARLTGITAHTLRAWEKRYDGIESNRSASGRRSYSTKQIERLTLLKFLVDRGSAISSVANISEKELKNRVAEFVDTSIANIENIIQQKPRVAVYGEYLPSKITNSNMPIDFILGTSDLNHFESDIKRLKPDALILEFTIIDEHTTALVSKLQKLSGARRIIVIYGYARGVDVQKLSDDVTCTFRAPVAIVELIKVLSAIGPLILHTQTASILNSDDTDFVSDIPPRRFDQKTLAQLASASTSIFCECPTHLVELVINLSRFEDYSASCSNRSKEDAALHGYLQHTTARARAMVEDALEKVAIAEGLISDKNK